MVLHKRILFNFKLVVITFVMLVSGLTLALSFGLNNNVKSAVADDLSCNFVLDYSNSTGSDVPDFTVSAFDFNGNLAFDNVGDLAEGDKAELGLNLLYNNLGYSPFYYNFLDNSNVSEELKETYKYGFLKFNLTLNKKAGQIYNTPFSINYINKLEVYTATSGSATFGRLFTKTWSFEDGKVVDDGLAISNEICAINYSLDAETGDFNDFVIALGRSASNLRIKLVFYTSQRTETRIVEKVAVDDGATISSNMDSFNTYQEVTEGGSVLSVKTDFAEGKLLRKADYKVYNGGTATTIFSIYGGIAIKESDSSLMYCYPSDSPWSADTEYFEKNNLSYADYSYSGFAYRIVFKNGITLSSVTNDVADENGDFVGTSVKLNESSLLNADYFVRFCFMIDTETLRPCIRIDKSNLSKNIRIEVTTDNYFYLSLNKITVDTEGETNKFNTLEPYKKLIISNESGSVSTSDNELLAVGLTSASAGFGSFIISGQIYSYRQAIYSYVASDEITGEEQTLFKRGAVAIWGFGVPVAPYVNIELDDGFIFEGMEDGLLSDTKYRQSFLGKKEIYAKVGEPQEKVIFNLNIKLSYFDSISMGLSDTEFDKLGNKIIANPDWYTVFSFAEGDTAIYYEGKSNINSKNGYAQYRFVKNASDLVDNKFVVPFSIKPSNGFYLVGKQVVTVDDDGNNVYGLNEFFGDDRVYYEENSVEFNYVSGTTNYTIDIVYYVDFMNIVFDVIDYDRFSGEEFKIGELNIKTARNYVSVKKGFVISVELLYKPNGEDVFLPLYVAKNESESSNLPFKLGYTFNGFSVLYKFKDRVFVYKSGSQFGYTDKIILNENGSPVPTGEPNGITFAFMNNLFEINGYANGFNAEAGGVDAMFTPNTYQFVIHNDFNVEEEELVVGEITYDTDVIRLGDFINVAFGYQPDFLATRTLLNEQIVADKCFKIGNFSVDSDGITILEENINLFTDEDGNWCFKLSSVWKDPGTISDIYLYVTARESNLVVNTGVFESDTNYWASSVVVVPIEVKIPYDAEYNIGDILRAYYSDGDSEVNFVYNGSVATLNAEGEIEINYFGQREIKNLYSARSVLEDPVLGKKDGVFSYLRGHEFYGYILCSDTLVNYQTIEEIDNIAEVVTDLGESSDNLIFKVDSASKELVARVVPVFCRGQYTASIYANTGVYDRESRNDTVSINYAEGEELFEFRSPMPDDLLTRLLVPVSPLGKTFVGYSIRKDLTLQGTERTGENGDLVLEEDLVKVIDYDFSTGVFSFVTNSGDYVNIENFLFIGSGESLLVDLITNTIFYATYVNTPYNVMLNVYDVNDEQVGESFVYDLDTDVYTYLLGEYGKPVLDDNGKNLFATKLTENGSTATNYEQFRSEIPSGFGGVAYVQDKIVFKNFSALALKSDFATRIGEGAGIMRVTLSYKDAGGAIIEICEYLFVCDNNGNINYASVDDGLEYIYSLETDELTLVIKDAVNLAYTVYPNAVFTDFVIGVHYDYPEYVVGFSAGVYVYSNEDGNFLLKTKESTVYYKVNYNTRDDFTTWLKCDANGVIDYEASRLTADTQEFVKVTIANQEIVFGVNSLLKTDESVKSVVVGGKSYFFAHWARINSAGEEEELATNGSDKVNICPNNDGGGLTYYTVFIDTAEINVKYYTWNSLAGLSGQGAYGVSGHYGYFWKNSTEIDHTLKNAYELYKFGDYYMFISGWVKVYDQMAPMSDKGNFSEVAGYDETYYSTVKLNSNFIILDSYARDYIYPDGLEYVTYYSPDGLESQPYYYSIINSSSGFPALNIDRNINGEDSGYYRNISFYAVYTVFRLEAIPLDEYGNEFSSEGEDTNLTSYKIEVRVPNDVLGNMYGADDIIWYRADKKRYDTFTVSTDYSNADLINNKDYMDADCFVKEDPNYLASNYISVEYLTGDDTPMSEAKELLLAGVKRKYDAENPNINNYAYFAIPVGYYYIKTDTGVPVKLFLKYTRSGNDPGGGSGVPTPLPSDYYSGVFDKVPELSRIFAVTDGQSAYADAYQDARAELQTLRDNGTISTAEFKMRELVVRYASQLLEWHRIVLAKVDSNIGPNSIVSEIATYSNGVKSTYEGATYDVGMIYEYELHFYDIASTSKPVSVDRYGNDTSQAVHVIEGDGQIMNNLLDVINQVMIKGTGDEYDKINYNGCIFTDCFGYIRICYSLAAYTINPSNPSTVNYLNSLYGHTGGYGGHKTFTFSGSSLTSLVIPGDMLVILGPSNSGYHVIMYTNKDNDGQKIYGLECVRQYDRYVWATKANGGAPNNSSLSYYQYCRNWGSNGERAITHYAGEYWGR